MAVATAIVVDPNRPTAAAAAAVDNDEFSGSPENQLHLTHYQSRLQLRSAHVLLHFVRPSV